nr:efflux transporter outer membrane subunit [Achromobacter sp. RTa]
MILTPIRSSLWRCAGAALCVAALAGCAVGPDFSKPANGLSEADLAPRQGDAGHSRLSAADVPAAWWLLFDDPVLASLQARAAAGNLDLQMAAERIEQSRAQLGIASSELLPSLDAGASYAREALSENGKLAALGAPSSATDFWRLGFNARWEIDLWGRARRLQEGAEASLAATAYEREAARVALSAEVARAYLQLRGTQAQLAIARQNLDVAERVLGLTQSRERHGVATRFETATARAQLAAVRALIPELNKRRNNLLNALALLMGERPRALDDQLRDAMPLPALPASVPVGVSSELARRRPDIRRAEAQLHAATAAIGVAKADFYPRISLIGQLGVEAFLGSDLDSWDSRYFSIGPTVYLPIFQGGRLVQRLALTQSRQKSAALAYRQTVLQAWHEVDNALDAWAEQQREHSELLVSYEQNKLALHAAERGYQQGASDYLTVLTAQRNLLASQTRLNASATNGTLTVVNLYKSLGGGWDPAEFEGASESAATQPVSHDRPAGARLAASPEKATP